MLFDIASEKGPLAAVSPETDREVKPVLCGQQGIITFPHGAPAPQQLSHIEGRDWNLIALTHSSQMAVHTWTLGITCAHTVQAELIWHRHKHRETRHKNMHTRYACIITKQRASLYLLLSAVDYSSSSTHRWKRSVWGLLSRSPSASLSLELRGTAASRFVHWSLDAISLQDLLTASHT